MISLGIHTISSITKRTGILKTKRRTNSKCQLIKGKTFWWFEHVLTQVSTERLTVLSDFFLRFLSDFKVYACSMTVINLGKKNLKIFKKFFSHSNIWQQYLKHSFNEEIHVLLLNTLWHTRTFYLCTAHSEIFFGVKGER